MTDKKLVFLLFFGCRYPTSTQKERLRGHFLGGNYFEDRFALVFEGFEYYSPLFIQPFFEDKLREGYAKSASVCKDNTLRMGLPVMSGYDDRQVRFPGTMVARIGSACYDMTWRVAMEQNPKWIMICSWNEWHEGSEIEPSVEYGDYYIKLTRQYADKFKGSS